MKRRRGTAGGIAVAFVVWITASVISLNGQSVSGRCQDSISRSGRSGGAVGESDPQAALGVMPPPYGAVAAARLRSAARLAGERGRSYGGNQRGATPRSAVLHRLNRTEYANAIRDLLGL